MAKHNSTRDNRRERFKRKSKINGRDYISEIEVEEKYGFPRELMELWSGQEIEAIRPPAKDDLGLRRQVLLNYYLGCIGTSWRGDGLLPEQLVRDVRDMYTGKYSRDKHVIERRQVLGIWAFLSYLETPDAPETAESLAKDFASDLTGPRPTRQEIREEYRRYLGMAG